MATSLELTDQASPLTDQDLVNPLVDTLLNLSSLAVKNCAAWSNTSCCPCPSPAATALVAILPPGPCIPCSSSGEKVISESARGRTVSKTTVRTPRAARAEAQARPEGPPPMTATVGSGGTGVEKTTCSWLKLFLMADCRENPRRRRGDGLVGRAPLPPRPEPHGVQYSPSN
ncbi:hypothetical protein E2562_012141 [Oryza meyeriana var. granulata]|uniref:Uncharacterized protein n=1 Tax=Oryza meyeriana var. granulata TaxID=110450 RepID=A0A6G1F7B0_9ORYZ|nr:hypothetical protein E2562_012141 [Oryza meyeriana var. granulata]